MYSTYFGATIYDMIIGLYPKFHVLPPSHEIDFVFTTCRDSYGWVTEEDEDWFIMEISKSKNKTLQDLTATIAHEMVHLYEIRTNGEQYHQESYDHHGKLFQKIRKELEKKLGFDIS